MDGGVVMFYNPGGRAGRWEEAGVERCFTVDAGAATPFEHFWERCVGSGHAALGLREDWRRHLRQSHEELGFEFVRFHGLLCDDMSACVRAGARMAGEERLVRSFYNIDSIFDFLLDTGMKPFVELSFMPGALASGPATVFHYRGNITPPRDEGEWAELIEALGRHLVERYGREEVRSWFFEVWNEPNLKDLFWTGTQEDYFRFYRRTAEALKRAEEGLRVGGPATARDGWIAEFVEFCRGSGAPLDFVSTHHYPTDVALGHYRDLEERMSKTERGALGRKAREVRAVVGELPLYYTEWHNSPSSRDVYHDLPYAGAFAVKTLADVAGVADIYSFWTFTDIFEEAYFPSVPFHGGFGLLNLHGVPKPTYRAFELLHHAGTERLAVAGGEGGTAEVLATRKAGALVLLAHNHNVPLAPIREEEVKIVLKGARVRGRATVERVDEDHANARKRWVEMGSPEYLRREEVEELMEASRLSKETASLEPSPEGHAAVSVKVPAHGVAALTIAME